MLRQSRYISTAAMEEVAELGHPEVDLDHLLVGLLLTGGPSASRLAAAGADLPSVRQAVQQLQAADTHSLGVQVAVPPAVRGGDAARVVSVPWGTRALAVMQSVDHKEDDRALLRALLDDEGRRVERVLSSAGVDLEVLRASLASGATAVALDVPVEVAAATAALGPARRCLSASVTHELPVSAEAVWAVLGDAGRRPEWDPAVDAVVDEGGVLSLVYRKGEKTRSVRVLFVRTGPGGVLWRELWHDAEDVTAVLHVSVTPDGAGCRLRVDTATLLRTRWGRASRPLASWAVGSRVRWLSQSIARAAAAEVL
ncbi:Clp protease N-terminal domain-containing protein [Pseudokineococcus sp. 1T1Z-3]|uniref:Clp protease N-terminal domain-containing protein n=1 Tax=Pseudokineococcus sp. 1T1Z-3 TaxID=3132745 RepID=UPI0030A7F8F2